MRVVRHFKLVFVLRVFVPPFLLFLYLSSQVRITLHLIDIGPSFFTIIYNSSLCLDLVLGSVRYYYFVVPNFFFFFFFWGLGCWVRSAIGVGVV